MLQYGYYLDLLPPPQLQLLPLLLLMGRHRVLLLWPLLTYTKTTVTLLAGKDMRMGIAVLRQLLHHGLLLRPLLVHAKTNMTLLEGQEMRAAHHLVSKS